MLTEQQRDSQVCDLIECAQECMAKSAQIQQAEYKRSQEIEAIIPDTLDALTENHHIAPEDRKKVASWLRNPVSAIQFLKTVAENVNQPRNNNSLGYGYKQANSRSGNTKAERIAEAKEDLYNSFGL